MADIIGSNSGDDFAFEFTESTEGAEAPPPLPDGLYPAQITQVTKGTAYDGETPQLVMTIVVDPEAYPGDYPPENAPGGMALRFFSLPLGDNKPGRWNMKNLCDALKIPQGNKFRLSDFESKEVEVDLSSKEMADGSYRNIIKGLPKAV